MFTAVCLGKLHFFILLISLTRLYCISSFIKKDFSSSTTIPSYKTAPVILDFLEEKNILTLSYTTFIYIFGVTFEGDISVLYIPFLGILV